MESTIVKRIEEIKGKFQLAFQKKVQEIDQDISEKRKKYQDVISNISTGGEGINMERLSDFKTELDTGVEVLEEEEETTNEPIIETDLPNNSEKELKLQGVADEIHL